MTIDNYLYEQGRKQINNEWTGTFNDYFNMAIKNPQITQLSIQRVYNMIMSYGVSNTSDGKVEYNFFKGRIFGAEKQIEDIMMYLKAASMGLDIKKRVLLLLGPPGGGKSQILSMLKKGLAKYSKTDKGAIFAIDGCPINEDPMHLIPETDRDQIWKQYKIKIEGKLCPVCQFRLDTEFKRNLNHVPVKRVYINEDDRTGVGTFAPSEKNDMQELYGSEDLSKIDYYGNSGDVRAYAFNGELHTANRGIMEFIEVLKANPAFLHVLLTLAEEQMFKTPRFPLQYVDEMLIAHTNEGEFLRFISNKENEAVVDRLYIVRMPYNMKYEHEELIYHHALRTKLVVDNVKVHPGAVRLASEFAIMTRGHDNPLRSGMGGISPRFVLNTLAISLVKTTGNIVSPFDMFVLLKDQISRYPVLTPEIRTEYLNYLEQLKNKLIDYEKLTSNDVAKTNTKTKENSSMFDFVIGEED